MTSHAPFFLQNQNKVAFSAPLSPSLDGQWMDELLSKSAPMTTTNSFSGIVLGQYNYDVTFQSDLSQYLDSESIFSGNDFLSSSETSCSDSPNIKTEAPDGAVPDLIPITNRPENSVPEYSRKTLESIFDTKGILKTENEPCSGPQRRQSEGSVSTLVPTKGPKRRNPRKRLTDTQKQAHNKIEKKYRININAKIAGLQQIIPWVAFEKTAFGTGDDHCDTGDMSCNRLNKLMILEKATDYVLYLQENERRHETQRKSLLSEIARLGGDVSKFAAV